MTVDSGPMVMMVPTNLLMCRTKEVSVTHAVMTATANLTIATKRSVWTITILTSAPTTRNMMNVTLAHRTTNVNLDSAIGTSVSSSHSETVTVSRRASAQDAEVIASVSRGIVSSTSALMEQLPA